MSIKIVLMKVVLVVITVEVIVIVVVEGTPQTSNTRLEFQGFL